MIYFLLYLFLETVVSVNIASALGGVLTFVEILLSALYGFFILANFRNSMGENFMMVVSGRIDVEEFERLNLFSFFGAILLIVPGFLTDIIGLLLQFSVITSMIANRYKKPNHPNHFKEESDDVIDVEIISKD